MSNPKNISLLAIMLLLINLSTNPVNSEMRKSWSRKTTVNETEKPEPISTQDIMKYFQENADKSDFESIFSDQTEPKDDVTDTNDKDVESEMTTETTSDELKDNEKGNDQVKEKSNDDSEKINDETKINEETNNREENDEISDDKANITETQRDIIRRGLNLIVLGRGKKNNWIERIVPLFILPFLIQSAIVPFIVQAIKLLLLKSLFVGKTALLLFLLGFFRNMKGGHHRSGAPYYLKEIPGSGPDDRLYENYGNDNGYQAEGAPYFIHKRSSDTNQ